MAVIRDMLIRSSRALDRCVSRLTLPFAALTLLVVMALPIVNLVGRHLLGLSWPALYDLDANIFFAFVMFSFGYAYLRDGHVRVDIVREHMSPRWVAGIELFACLTVVLPLSGYLVVYGTELAWLSWVQGERDAVTGLPLQWLVRVAVPLGFLSLLLSALSVATRCARDLARAPAAPVEKD